MKNILKTVLLTAILCASTLPAAAQKSWTSQFSGITHKGKYAPWVYEVKVGAERKIIKNKISAALVALSYDRYAGNHEVFDLREKILTAVRDNKIAQRKEFIKSINGVDGFSQMMRNYDTWQQAANNSEVFKNYALTGNCLEAFKMPAERAAVLTSFLAAPAKNRKEGEVGFALKYKDGLVLLELPGQQERTSIFLLANPDTFTLQVMYKSYVLQEGALSATPENLLEGTDGI